MADITPKERAELASIAGINEQYLYQCLTRRRDMDATEAARVEEATGKRLRRWHLRSDWYVTWPELRRLKGAPPIPPRPQTD